MRRTRVFATAMLALLAISTVALTNSAAADYSKVGLKVGDTADYLVHRYNGQVFRYHLVVWEIFTTYHFSDEGSINFAEVYFDVTVYYLNGTLYQKSVDGVNLYLGLIYMGYMGLTTFDWLIAADLQPGDQYYTGWGSIQSTISMFTAGAYREVNMISENGGIVQRYWDKETGLLVRSCYKPSEYGSWDNVTLQQTTAWAPTGSYLILTVSIAGVSAICVATLLLLRFHKRKRR